MDIEALLARRLREADVEVPGLGTVRVRELSRSEALQMRAMFTDGTDHGIAEQTLLAFGMVDPALTPDQAKQVHEALSYNDLEPVLTRIGELSGFVETDKERYASFRDESGEEVHVPAGEGSGDDGGSTPGGNEQ